MLIKACFLIQPLELEGWCQKCCISLCSKVFINHFYQMKASPECLNILTYWSKYWVDRLRRTLRRIVETGIFYQQICRLCHYISHQVAHIDCSTPSGKQHEPLTGVCVIALAMFHVTHRVGPAVISDHKNICKSSHRSTTCIFPATRTLTYTITVTSQWAR